MKNIFKRVVIFTLIISMSASFIIGVSYSCIYDNSLSQEKLDRDVRYWKQGRVPNDNSLITGKGNSQTIGEAACSHFAMSYALVKMGILNPENGDTPITHIEKAREYSAFRQDWGYYEFAKAPEMYDGIIYEGVDMNVDELNAADGLAYVKGLLAKGYYVIAIVYNSNTKGHCIFFDGINEDGTMSIGDSAYEGTTWEECYGDTETYFYYLELLRYDKKPSNAQPSIYSDNILKDKIPEEDIERYNSLVKEKDLTGMPLKSNIKQYAKIPIYKSADSLMQHEKDSVVAIKEQHDSKTITVSKLIGSIASFIGIILVVYAIFLIACFVLDCVNSFSDIDFVKMATLGHIKVVMDKTDYEGSFRKGYVTIVKLFIIVAVVFTAGILLINGTILRFLYYVVCLFS